MKASKTILGFERLQEIDAKNAESNFIDALVDVAREQAEVSFKAGIREVVEWIESLNPNYPDVPIGIAFSVWEDKLKEWEQR
jgi:hypothetical protein